MELLLKILNKILFVKDADFLQRGTAGWTCSFQAPLFHIKRRVKINMGFIFVIDKLLAVKCWCNSCR